MEHYYADGRVIYLNMWMNPFSLDSVPESREELIAAFNVTDGGMGTYELYPEKDSLKITLKTSTDTAWIGKSFEVKYEIIEDTIVFQDKHHFIRVKD